MDKKPHAGVGIRITSDPDVTRVERTAAETARRVDLPFRMLYAADLTPGQDGRVSEVDRDSVGALLASLAPRLSIEVANEIGSEPRLLDVALTIRSIDDFRPERVAEQVPPLKALLNVRSAVKRLREGDLDVTEFHALVEREGLGRAWTDALLQALTSDTGTRGRSRGPSAPARRDDAVDRLLSLVDSGAHDESQETEREPSSDSGGLVDALMSAVLGAPDPTRVEKPAAEMLIAELDDLLARQLNAILAHPDFRNLEVAWRGLRFLTDRVSFRDGVRLDVLPVRREALSDVMYESVLLPEHAREGDRPPLSALILGFEFDASARDVETLEDLASTGSSLQIPVMASAGPAFFEVAAYRGLEQLPPLRQHLSGPAWIAWQKLRVQPESAHIALALPGVPARYPYGAANPVRGFELEEKEAPLLGGALVVAVAMANGFARAGWPSRLRGAEFGVEGLPLLEHPRGASPLGAVLSGDRQADFAEAGFTVVSGRLNRDAAYISHAPSIFQPERYGDSESDTEAAVHASLPCQLFTSRAAQFLLVFKEELGEGLAPEAVREELAERLRTLLSRGGRPAAPESVEVDLHNGDAHMLVVRLRPPAEVLEERVSLVMGLEVPGHA